MRRPDGEAVAEGVRGAAAPSCAQNGHRSTENAVGLSEIWCLFHMFEQTTEWLLGTQEPDSSAISCLYQNYLQRDGEMGEKLWAGNKEKSGKLVVPKNKGAVLQNFRNR